jgi:hypothetical protein
MPLGPHVDVKPALARGAVDRAVEVQFLRRAFPGEAAQAAERDLDVAGAELLVAVEVANSTRPSPMRDTSRSSRM